MKLIVKLILTALFFISANAAARGTADICESDLDLSGFEIVSGDLDIAAGDNRSGDIYVLGEVSINGANSNRRTTYDGSIYATGNVYIGKKVTVTGFVYSEQQITLHNQGNIIIVEGTCSGGEPIPSIDLPVDELTEQCSAIFQDAAQSYSSSGHLTMWGSSQIIDDTNAFDFYSHEPYGNANGCGVGVQCTSTGEQSAELSSFTIPTIDAPDITVASWSGADGLNITLGDPDSATDKFKGTAFGDITVHNGGTLTFASQIPEHVYRINRLNVYDGGVVYLNAGVYAIRGLGVTNESSRIEVGEGDVYLFVSKSDSVQGSIERSNTALPGQFVFVTGETVAFNGNARFSGSLYANGNVELNGNTYIEGRVASANLQMTDNTIIENELECGVPPVNDYVFEITTSADALTCEPHPVFIQVLLDGNPATDYVGLINLSTSTDKGVWNKLNADGTLTDVGSADNGQASYQFVASDQGIIELGLFNNIASDLTVSVSSGAVSNVSNLISFRPFQLKSELSCNNGIDASPCFTTANLPFALTLTAVGKDPDADGCEVIEEYTGDKNLKFWSSYVEPEVPVGLNVEVNQTVIEKNATDATEQSVTFLNGVATVSVNYPDAGQIQIHARDDQGIGAPPADPGQDDELQGSAITIVNPLQLIITPVSDNPAELSDYDPITGTGFKRAAVRSHSTVVDVDTFDITVKAVIDCSDDPLNHCTNGTSTVTPSFSNSVTLLPTLVFPTHASASIGTVHSEDGSNALTAMMSGGELIYSDLSYDEVGVLGLQATSVNYIQTGNDITVSDVKEIGRFYPNYLAYDNYHYQGGCNSNDFTYMTEGLATDTPLLTSAVSVNYVMQAKAQASASATEKTTENYHYDVNNGYPVAATANFSDVAYATNDSTNVSERILPVDYYDETQWEAGVYTITGLAMGLQKSLTAADGPYFSVMPDGTDNQIEYFITLSGIDGEKLQTNASTPCTTTNQCRLPADINLSSFGDLAYGRLQAGNGHGSEFQPVRTTVQATYYDGSHFVPMIRDICSTTDMSQVSAIPVKNATTDKIEITDPQTGSKGKTKVRILNTPLINGQSFFDFSAPSPSTRGKLDYFINLKSNTSAVLDAPWLLDSGNAVACPSATGTKKDCISGEVSFGLFRGNDRIIYRLQTFE